MSSVRRHARYPINLRVRLKLPSGEVETITDEVSLGGFSAPCVSTIEVGERLDFVIHLPDEREVDGTASAVRFSPDGSAGFSCEFNPVRAQDWEAFLAQEQAAGGVWRMIGRYVSSGGQSKADARSLVQRGVVRRAGSTPDEPAEAAAVVRLHMVGENGEAYRLAFEKHGGHRPDDSPWARSNPRVLELTRRAASRVLDDEVLLKRSPSAPIIGVRLVELSRGGYASVQQLPSGQPSLMGLQGSELLVVEADGRAVFPNFDASELERIAHDTFRRDPLVPQKPAATSAALNEERFAPNYVHKTLDSRRGESVSLAELQAAMASSERMQTRVYAGRQVRLFPELWLEVSRLQEWRSPARGFALDDGRSTCVFVMAGPDGPCVVRLEATDDIVIIRG